MYLIRTLGVNILISHRQLEFFMVEAFKYKVYTSIFKLLVTGSVVFCICSMNEMR